ncbi:hypothetical protein J2S19_003132 [Metabacillus malikii]|uniref:Lipoprotein n=2 Tax=Metabacillus malikii TaxID=1504265 RepID=A0ABT9ZJ64_9BACI|nr:hypothetical protein [Metabacillus malikii]
MKKLFLISILLVLLFACGNSSIDEANANDIALKYVQEGSNDSWYVSQTKSKGDNWLIHTKILGNNCIEKYIYIHKKSGSISDVRGGNEC